MRFAESRWTNPASIGPRHAAQELFPSADPRVTSVAGFGVSFPSDPRVTVAGFAPTPLVVSGGAAPTLTSSWLANPRVTSGAVAGFACTARKYFPTVSRFTPSSRAIRRADQPRVDKPTIASC